MGVSNYLLMLTLGYNFGVKAIWLVAEAYDKINWD